MKKYIYIAIAVVTAALFGAFAYMGASLRRAKAERDRYRMNAEVLMSDVETYRVRDSLSVARVEGLELTVRELEKYRADDAALVKALRTKVKELTALGKAGTVTEYVMAAPVHDTIIVVDSVRMPARVVECGDRWYHFRGMVTEQDFAGEMESRDSIIVAESVQYRRFLGFLWKTKRVKSRTMEVTSKNPHTTVVDAELITIKK